MNQLNNNQISNEPSDAPTLCNSCFEFFGSKHTDGLCSGCFKTKCKEEVQQVKPISIVPDNSDAKTDIETPSASHKVSIDEESLAIEAPKPIVEAVVEDKPKPKETNKCHKCSKKVSVLGFKCKCESTFCKAHRLPEDHDCDFDFKLAGAAKLTKENPVIVASKISKI